MLPKRNLTNEQKESAIKLALDGKSYIQTAQFLGISPQLFRLMRERDPSFALLLIQAREEAIDHLVTTVTDLVDQYDNPNAARAKFDAIKWRAAVTDPARYGDRLNLDVTQNIDMTKILRDAQSRLSPLLDQPHEAIESHESEVEELQLQDNEPSPQSFDDLK